MEKYDSTFFVCPPLLGNCSRVLTWIQPVCRPLDMNRCKLFNSCILSLLFTVLQEWRYLSTTPVLSVSFEVSNSVRKGTLTFNSYWHLNTSLILFCFECFIMTKYQYVYLLRLWSIKKRSTIDVASTLFNVLFDFSVANLVFENDVLFDDVTWILSDDVIESFNRQFQWTHQGSHNAANEEESGKDLKKSIIF